MSFCTPLRVIVAVGGAQRGDRSSDSSRQPILCLRVALLAAGWGGGKGSLLSVLLILLFTIHTVELRVKFAGARVWGRQW